MASKHIPSPKVLPDHADYWQAANEGRLLVPRCTACGRHHWYPRRHCPFCHADTLAWTESPGRGTVYSYSVMRKAEGGAYVIAYVTLDEQVTLLTNLVHTEPDAVRIGQRVRVVFVPSADGQAVPMFEPGDA